MEKRISDLEAKVKELSERNWANSIAMTALATMFLYMIDKDGDVIGEALQAAMAFACNPSKETYKRHVDTYMAWTQRFLSSTVH